MNYILIDRESGKKTEIKRNEALKIVKKNYRKGENVLEIAETTKHNTIMLQFNILKVNK